MFQIFQKNHLDPLKVHFWAFLTKFNSKTKHFQWKLMIKAGYLDGRLQGVQISVWWLFSLDSYLSRKILLEKLEKSCMLLTEGSFDQFFGKIWSVIIFEPHEEWSWNFQDSILFMKASYGSSFNKIWSVNHGHFRNSWWFDMEWPTTENMKFSIKDFFSKCDQICCFLRIWSHLLEKPLWKISLLVQWK